MCVENEVLVNLRGVNLVWMDWLNCFVVVCFFLERRFVVFE